MPRTITGTMRTAIDSPHGINIKLYADIWPSRAFSDTLTANNATSSPDPVGIVSGTPKLQDIEYSSTYDYLVTFWSSGSDIYYAKHTGSSAILSNLTNNPGKPGVLGSKLFAYHTSGEIRRYSIDWSVIDAGNPGVFSLDTSASVGHTCQAVHAISDTEAVAVAYSEGGFVPYYISGSTAGSSDQRFMFPKEMDFAGSGRANLDLAAYSAGLLIDNKAFVYMSHASKGIVQGIYYDKDTGQWSDIFTVMPTDLQTSMCEFRVANAYTRNGTAYLCGQFSRTDAYGTPDVYSLLLYSQDGKLFSIDRLTLVSDIGYRFQARVGSDNYLYLGNSNRICKKPVTWVFDGTNGTNGTKKTLTDLEIKAFSDNDYNATLNLKAGDETLMDDADIVNEAKVDVYVGYDTTAGSEMVLYGTYISMAKSTGFRDGQRLLSLRLQGEAMWRLAGLSMPFYVELFGLSVMYDPLKTDSGKLYAAANSARTETQFWVDFWGHTEYSNSTYGITGIDMNDQGGVNYYEATGSHKLGILGKDVKAQLGLKEYPEITNTSIGVEIHGWSHPVSSGSADIAEVIVVVQNEDGTESVIVSNEDKRWKTTYPNTYAGNEPISFTLGGFTVGQKIRQIGVAFENTVDSWFNIARVEITSGVLVSFYEDQANTPWTREEGGYFTVPGSGKPFIMFSQRPYDSFNFMLVGKFANTTSGSISGYDSAVGLVGLAEDAENYIVGKYDKTGNKVKITKVRDGIETLLASATPSFSVDDEMGVAFVHKNGKFWVSLWDENASTWKEELTYTWKAADGYMFTSDVASKKSGIYGAILAPSYPILGYWHATDESLTNADGIPADIHADLTDFPTTGQVKIGENVYSYTGKVDVPALPRGPYQYRQAGTYGLPYGNGGTGLEVRDFDWNASTSGLNGLLAAISSGANFIINGALWQIFTTTGGATSWHRNRARYYSANPQIRNLYHTLSHKVWVTGGLTGINRLSGTTVKHMKGDMCTYHNPGSIKCYWYMGAGGNNSTTIADLIGNVCQLAGTQANFPGDYTSGSLAVSGWTTIATTEYADGFDLYFDTQSAHTVQLRANVAVDPEDYDEWTLTGDTLLQINITKVTGNEYKVSYISQTSGSVLYEQTSYVGDGSSPVEFRVLFHEDGVTVMANGSWLSSCTFAGLIYPETTLTIEVNGSYTLENIRLRELGEWREAIYIDLETDAQSAIGSIIQERPVEYYMNPDGRLDLWYDYTGGSIPYGFEPKSHTIAYLVPTEGASDAIIYSSKEAKTLQFPLFAKALGFATRVMRYPNLVTGAVKAAYISLKRTYQRSENHELSMRPDVSVRHGDVLQLDYMAGATGRTMQKNIVVENINLEIKNGRADMGVRGRKL